MTALDGASTGAMGTTGAGLPGAAAEEPSSVAEFWLDRRLLMIVGLALLIRAGWCLFLQIVPISDQISYHNFAVTMVEHGTYGWRADQPTAFWPVGYSAALAGIYLTFGQALGVVEAFNTAVSVGIVWLTGLVGRHYFGVRIGLLAALLTALWPTQTFFTTVLASEPLFMFLFLAGVVAVIRSDGQSLWGWALAGLFWALAVYVRPVAMLVPFVFGALYVLRAELGPVRAAGRVAVAAVVVALTVAPWTYRNYVVFDAFVPVSTNLGPILWMGNHPETTGGFSVLPDWTDEMDEVERAAALKEKALGYIVADPAGFVLRTAWKLVRTHERETIGVTWNQAGLQRWTGPEGIFALKTAATSYWFAMLSLAAIAIGALIWRQGLWRGVVHPVPVFWAYYASIHAVTIAGDRYHMPSAPMIAILAAIGLAVLLSQGQRGPTTPRPAAA